MNIWILMQKFDSENHANLMLFLFAFDCFTISASI